MNDLMKDNAEKLKNVKNRLIARGIYGIPTSPHDLLPLCKLDTDFTDSLQNGIEPQFVFDSYCREAKEKLLSRQSAAKKQLIQRKEQILCVLSEIFSALHRTETALQQDTAEILRYTFKSEADKRRIAEEFLNLNRFLDSIGHALRESDHLGSSLCAPSHETWTLKAAALLWNLTLSEAYSAWDNTQRAYVKAIKELLQSFDEYRNFAFLVQKLTADLQREILSTIDFTSQSLPTLLGAADRQLVLQGIRAYRIRLRQLASDHSLPIEN